MYEYELTIIKLGGSVITDKNKKGLLRKSVLKRLAGEIATAKNKKKFKLIIVHGAGSFGHPIAKQYRLNEGFLNNKSIEGFVKTKQSLNLLTSEVFKYFSEKVQCCLVQPADIVLTSKDKIVHFDTKQISYLLDYDITPILWGDVVFDIKKGFSILSGDKIVAYLAKKFKADNVLFISDVEGVFDKNPKIYGDAKLIKVINGNSLARIKTQQTKNRIDVTGEMKGKILDIKINLQGVPVQVLSGLKMGNLDKAVVQGLGGTRLQFG